jgi:SAM-dependent methyltransferase
MDAPSNWYESFFTGVAVDMWRHAIPPAVTEREADLIVRLLEQKPNASLLDVPCGSGRLARVLHERGYRVTGVDLSEESLAHARLDGGGVVWDCRDMRDLPWRDVFDGAYCFGNSFGYLDDAGNEAFLRSVAATLKRGGRFVLETPMVAESALLTIKERGWWKVGDVHLLVANRFDPPSGRLETEYTFVSNGLVDVRHGTHRVYMYRQLMDLFRAAGFSDVTAWTCDHARTGGASGETAIRLDPYRPGAAMLMLVGRVP